MNQLTAYLLVTFQTQSQAVPNKPLPCPPKTGPAMTFEPDGGDRCKCAEAAEIGPHRRDQNQEGQYRPSCGSAVGYKIAEE
jgi:hypothetical protein